MCLFHVNQIDEIFHHNQIVDVIITQTQKSEVLSKLQLHLNRLKNLIKGIQIVYLSNPCILMAPRTLSRVRFNVNLSKWLINPFFKSYLMDLVVIWLVISSKIDHKWIHNLLRPNSHLWLSLHSLALIQSYRRLLRALTLVWVWVFLK